MKLKFLPKIVSQIVCLGVLMAACGDGSGPSSTEPAITDSVASTSIVTQTTSTQTASTPTPTDSVAPDDGVARISVEVGVDSAPDRVEEVRLGQDVELTLVNPDDDDEFHLHGYDLGGDETPAGEEKVFAFTATEAGEFEVESHATGEVLVVIRVS